MEMKGFIRAACIVALVMPVLTVAKEYGCDDVNWGEEVLKEFPNAAKACQGVMMKGDQPYAKFTAEVESANKEQAVVHFLDKQDKPLSKVTFGLKEGATVKVDGKDTRVSDLKKGDRVSFYVQHKKWGLYANPDGTAPLTVLSREQM
jgi:hypothetical protein